MISSLLSHGELFIHSREARNEHLLSVPLGSFSDALCFIYLIYQLEYVLYCIVLYCIVFVPPRKGCRRAESRLNLTYVNQYLSKNNKQTEVTNITRQRMLQKISFMNLTFRMLQHTFSEVTVT